METWAISQFALARVLAEVALIAAEDTRHTRKLLNHLGVQTRLTSYYEHNKLSKLDAILETLLIGDVALVSDAGTPAINDPGYVLVRAVLEAGHRVSPIPGPSAPIAALAASGLPTDQFTYLGYLPRKTVERRQKLKEIQHLPYTLVFLETPHRLCASLDDVSAILGDRRIAIARELTKLHEEIFRGLVSEAVVYYAENPPRGEITMVIEAASQKKTLWLLEQVESALEKGYPGESHPLGLLKKSHLNPVGRVGNCIISSRKFKNSNSLSLKPPTSTRGE